MARRPRLDTPGSWHHVINRGIAKRPYFESRSDKRYFLAQLASEVRARRLEVHAYCLMTTHFHLLVRSPRGEMSEGMRRSQCSYTRFFNRRRRRDGPLIRARYYSKRIDSLAYRRAVLRYVDANPVHAGVVAVSANHEFGSARRYLEGRRPPWLSSYWVEQRALELTQATRFNATTYLAAFGPRKGEDLDSLAKMIEMRMTSTAEVDPLDDLVGKTPREVLRWMKRKAFLADRTQIGLPVCGPAAVQRSLEQCVQGRGEWLVDHGSRTCRGSEVARVGLLRDLCSMPVRQVASLCDVTAWTVRKREELHMAAIQHDREYAQVVSGIAHRALAAVFPE